MKKKVSDLLLFRINKMKFHLELIVWFLISLCWAMGGFFILGSQIMALLAPDITWAKFNPLWFLVGVIWSSYIGIQSNRLDAVGE